MLTRLRAGVAGLVLITGLGVGSIASAGSAPAATTSCATLASGTTGAAVADAQSAIGTAADGDFGPMTKAALVAWQRAHHLATSGVVDAATWAALPRMVSVAACGSRVGGSSLTPSCTTLTVGATGVAVAVLQRAVGTTPDGGFGPLTLAAVRAAQSRLKLPVTGVADKGTWTALHLTGTPACVGAVTAAVSTPAPTPTPTPPADAAAQAAVATKVKSMVAQLPALAGTPTGANAPIVNAIVAYAKAQIGKPYKYGATGLASYDCSGLVMASYLAEGLQLQRVAAAQYTFGAQVPLTSAQAGDLVFWASDVTKPATIYHVGIYLGRGQVLHAPQTGETVKISNLWTSGLLPVAVRPVAQLVLPLRSGMSGWAVRQLQQDLVHRGVPVNVDGGYGPQVIAAVKVWQSAHHLPVTGAVDLVTWLSLA